MLHREHLMWNLNWTFSTLWKVIVPISHFMAWLVAPKCLKYGEFWSQCFLHYFLFLFLLVVYVYKLGMVCICVLMGADNPLCRENPASYMYVHRQIGRWLCIGECSLGHCLEHSVMCKGSWVCLPLREIPPYIWCQKWDVLKQHVMLSVVVKTWWLCIWGHVSLERRGDECNTVHDSLGCLRQFSCLGRYLFRSLFRTKFSCAWGREFASYSEIPPYKCLCGKFQIVKTIF